MKKTFCIGDIHGGYKALMQVLHRVHIVEGDTLIFLGDYVDGWSESYEVIEKILYLRTIYNVITLKGNHDQLFNAWIIKGVHPFRWQHGADMTARSYAKQVIDRDVLCDNRFEGFKTNLTSFDISKEHKEFFDSLLPYHIQDNKLFVHGGFNRHELIKNQSEAILLWDRDLWSSALAYGWRNNELNNFKIKEGFSEVYIGHTPTLNWNESRKGRSRIPMTKPMNAANIWNLDTGGGYKGGKLTIMDINTKEYFQSDFVGELYPEEKGR